MQRSRSSSIVIALLFATSAVALENGLGRTPQMGWNTWNKFGCSINEHIIRDNADRIVELGLDKLGYKYVNIDDCWMLADRDDNDHMQVDPATFPNGMKAVGDYIHSKGLLFGIYSSAGTYTCEFRAGSLDYEEIDAQDWADWGVDYLKYDNCFSQGRPSIDRYTKMRDALNATGRPILYSICSWGEEDPPSWASEVGNSWRTTADIRNIWSSVENNFRKNQARYDVAKPGAWNDPDMLEIGNGGLSHDEEKTHFALWALVKSPLIIGCDLVNIKKESLDILTNKNLIDVNQDTLGVQGHCKKYCSYADWFTYSPQIYAAPMANGDTVVVVVNWGNAVAGEISFDLSEVDIQDSTVNVVDLWTGDSLGEVTGTYTVKDLPPHGNAALRFSSKKQQQ